MNKLAFIFFLGIKKSLESLGAWLKTLGPGGLFTISLVDSAGVPLPGGPDAVMIFLSAERPWLMPLYAFAATLGSTIGCTLMYLAARRAGVMALKRVSAERRERIENLLGRYDMLAIMVPAVLPPPFPFKPFVLSAGVFKLKLSRFVAAIFMGRAARFLIEGWLAVELGESAGDAIKQHGLKVLIAVALIVVVVIAFKLYRARRAQALPADEAQSRQ
ncbi:MAG TPA: VTT domain-containing protein [Blastocatellia bacterium]|nr:VTT domain-containing protein [Blastocatellia bacterium]